MGKSPQINRKDPPWTGPQKGLEAPRGPAPHGGCTMPEPFGFPVKTARLAAKGKHHAALNVSLLGWRWVWQGPRGHVFALPKVSAALGSLDTRDCTPTAARGRPTAGCVLPPGRPGQPWVSCLQALLAIVREGQPRSLALLQRAPSEAHWSTRHTFPAQGLQGRPWTLHGCLPLAPQGRNARLGLHKALSLSSPDFCSLPWKEKTTGVVAVLYLLQVPGAWGCSHNRGQTCAQNGLSTNARQICTGRMRDGPGLGGGAGGGDV